MPEKDKSLTRVQFWVGIVAALGGGLVFPLAGNLSTYGAMMARVTSAEAQVTKLEKKIDQAVTRDEFMGTFGQIQHQLTAILADIRQLNRGEK